MSPHTSPKKNTSQTKSPDAEKFAARLREERIRLEPNQGRFAKRIGLRQQKQSFLETGYRELRADYLAMVAAEGVDVHYVLTGERSEGRLSRETSDLVTLLEGLDPALRRAATDFLRHLRAGPAAPQPAPALPPRQALAQMFEGLLMAAHDLTGDALADALAAHLPAALEIAQRPMHEEEDDQGAAAA